MEKDTKNSSGTALLPGGALCISLDFELFWGVRDKRSLDAWALRLLNAREAVKRMLDIFAAYGVQATWATVGALMCRGKREFLEYSPQVRPAYDNPRLSPYGSTESLGESETADPYHFAPSLVARIRDTPGQEVGCHTYAHYYCQEPGHSVAAFSADVQAAQNVAALHGLRLQSLVFPRNQVGQDCLDVCLANGISAYRGRARFWGEKGKDACSRAARLANAYFPLSGSGAWRLENTAEMAPVNIRASHFLRPHAPGRAFLEPVKLKRLEVAMEAASRKGRVLHLWWHPHNFGDETEANMAALRTLLEKWRTLHEKKGMQSLHMAGLAALAKGNIPEK